MRGVHVREEQSTHASKFEVEMTDNAPGTHDQGTGSWLNMPSCFSVNMLTFGLDTVITNFVSLEVTFVSLLL